MNIEEYQKNYNIIFELTLKAHCCFSLAMHINEIRKRDELSEIRNLSTLLIDALIHSALVNIVKVYDDSKDNEINLRRLKNKVLQSKDIEFKSDVDAMDLRQRLNAISDAEGRIRNRRNKQYAHSDKSLLSDDFTEVNPAYIEDMDKMIQCAMQILSIFSRAIDGVDFVSRDIKTGACSTTLGKKILFEWDLLLKSSRDSYEFLRIIADNIKKMC